MNEQNATTTVSATLRLRIKTHVRAGGDRKTTNHGLRIKTHVRAGGVKHNHGLRIKTHVRAGATLNHGLRIKTHVRAGGDRPTHNHGLRIKTHVRAGGDIISLNHGLCIKTRVRAGALSANHGLRIKTHVRAGALSANHGLRVETLERGTIMHSRFIVRSWSLLLAGFGLTACVEEEAVELADSGSEQVEFRNYPPVACSSGNLIGELDSPGVCEIDVPEEWDVKPLFINYTPEIQAWGETRPDALKKFCAFEYVGNEDIQDFHYIELFDHIDTSGIMSVETVEVDCLGQAMGDGLSTEAVNASLATLYHDAIQWVTREDLGSTQQYRVLPEIAILDTASQAAADQQANPVNMHGLFMGRIAGDIACPTDDSTCLQKIRYHVAMPRVGAEAANYQEGGHHGTMGDLATALVAAVGQWREARLADPTVTPRLVVSLSLGWDTIVYDSERAPTRALEMALNFAACNGAIVVAASGNSPNPECPIEEGPLSPATYQQKSAPTEQTCASLGFEPIDDVTYPVFGSARPLVYAVGGVDAYFEPIINARPESTPPLVTYASNVTVGSNGSYTTPLTGTSVSAAQVAAIAGLIWSYEPTATPDWVMSQIYSSGEDLGVDAHFYHNINNRDVRLVSVCAALDLACSGNCPSLTCNPNRAVSMAGLFSAIDDAIQDPNNTVQTFHAGAPDVEQCDPLKWDEQSDPQPEHPICPECEIDSPSDAITGNDVVYMTVKPEYQGEIEAIKLVVKDDEGDMLVFNFEQWVVDSVNNTAVDITEVYLEAPDTASANLAFKLSDQSTQDGAILVR